MSIVLALAAAALSGSGDFLGGLASRTGPHRVLSVVFTNHVAGLLVVLAIGPLFSGGLDGSTLVWGSLAGASGALAVVALYTGFARSTIAVVSPVAAVGAGIWPVLWDVTGGDLPGPVAGSGIVIGLVAIWVISSGGHVADADDVSSGVLYGVLAGLGFGGLLICLSLAPAASGIWALVPARAVGGAVIVAVAVAQGRSVIPAREALIGGSGAGALTLLGNAAFILAAARGSLAVVSVLAAMFPAATVLLARIVLGEQLTRQRRVGLALALVAIGLVAGG